MATNNFKLPDLGEGVHEGQIVRVMVAVGDTVREDQPLMEVETDKAAVVIPSPFTGTVQAVHVKDGQMVHVGDVMVTIAPGPGMEKSTPGAGRATSVASGANRTSAASQPPPLKGRGSAASAAQPASGTARRTPASPAVRKLARSMGVDVETIRGSGPGGRVQRVDLEMAGAKPQAANAHSTTPRISAGIAPSPLPSPSRGRGSAASASQPVAARVSIAPLQESMLVEPAGAGEDASDSWGAVKKAQVSQARKTIANVMSQSWSTIPHATDFDDADVTDLDHLRRGYLPPDGDSGGRKITMLAFVIRAVVRALQKLPDFNAHIDIEKSEIIYKRYFNIAVGVHTPRGLVPMVLRDADRMTIPQISDELAIISEKARTATFTVNDTRGGTYMISNAGAMGGSRYSTPIITPGQAAVLAVGRTRWMPWVIEQENGSRGIAPRLIMPLSHSIDHRLLDGGQEVQFMQHVIGDLQNPARLLL
jgi:pyruvate/2-oxoglutarate dehydrogenase complex dihydrolipoamide acyltransferase (E2) component